MSWWFLFWLVYGAGAGAVFMLSWVLNTIQSVGFYENLVKSLLWAALWPAFLVIGFFVITD